MSYSQFTLQELIRAFNLQLLEADRFLKFDPTLAREVSPYLLQYLERNIQLAVSLNTEKARSELVICPLLLATKDILHDQISFFSGEPLDVDPETGLNGVCDFILSRSPEQLFIKAPVAVIVEAKKEDLKGGLGQCAAEMVGAQTFNQIRENPPTTIYGAVTTGTVWRFLKLDNRILTIDLNEHALPPVEPILGAFVEMLWIEAKGS